MKEGIITAPLIYSLLDYQKHSPVSGPDSPWQTMHSLILRRFSHREESSPGSASDDISTGTRLLFDSRGIEVADLLSLLHVEKAVESLEAMAYPAAGGGAADGDGDPIIQVDSEDGYARTLLGLALKVKTRKY